MGENISKEERRMIRQKRKKRNRMIAIVVSLLILAVLGVGIFFGVKAAISLFGGNSEAEEVVAEEEPEVTPEIVVEEEPIIDMTPEIIEEATEQEEEEVPQEPEQTDDELLDEMVRTMVGEMTLEEKVAGIFIVSPEQLTGQGNVEQAGEGTKAALEKYPVGGIIYTKKNFKSSDKAKEMIDNTISFARYPLFLAVREEGGDNLELASGLKLDKIPSAKKLGEEGNSSAAFDAYNTVGSYLSEYHLNLNFAPVADVLTNPANTSIGDRSFGDDPVNVAAMVEGSIGGLKEAGVATCVMHFPGQGNANGDPNQSFASTEKTKADMENCEFVPFVKAIEAGTDMIMISHVSAPELTGDNSPCSISKSVVTGILREELGYDGVIITDALNVASITEYYAADEIAIKAIKSGADMILLPEDFELAYNGVLAAIEDGTIDERRIDDALVRIYKVKYRDTLTE